MSDNKDPKETSSSQSRGIARRDIIQGLAGIPVLGLFGYALQRQTGYDRTQRAARTPQPARMDLPEVNVALLGAGEQGQVLMHAMLKIPNIRIRAVCDIWTEYALRRVVNTLGRFDMPGNGYEDYREMLDNEKELDAVIISTPDFWHAPHTVDCLRAGLHVYCEKEMSNTIEGARSMVEAARETGKFLQIGHQRRSHPRYRHCYEKLIKEANLLGRIVTVNGQWNRTVQPDLGYPARYAIPTDRLRRYGFQSMAQFRNWRWYRGLGGGPIVDLGSHQIDIYNWFLEANPRAVLASGGLDYYSPETREWYDTVMAVFEYETTQGVTRAYYQTQTTNGSQGYFENFMGDQGTLVISESEVNYPGLVFREVTAPAWDEWVQRGYVTRPQVIVQRPEVEAMLDVRESISPDEHRLPIEFHDAYHKPHLENFLYAMLGLEPLNCPAEVGYESAVTVLKVNEAIESGRRIEYKPEEFHI